MTEKEKDIFYRLLGQRILEARKKSNIKQTAFAEALQLSRASIVNIEKGRQRPPLHIIYSISKLTRVPVSEIIPEELDEKSGKDKVYNKKFDTELKNTNTETRKVLLKFLKDHT